MSGSDEHWTIWRCPECAHVQIEGPGQCPRSHSWGPGPTPLLVPVDVVAADRLLVAGRERDLYKAGVETLEREAEEYKRANATFKHMERDYPLLEAERDRLQARVAELETGLRKSPCTCADHQCARCSVLSGGVSGDQTDKEKP